jgi:hypothetical protein
MDNFEMTQPEPSGCETAVTTIRQPVLIIAFGRQRVGKTTVLNVMIEVFRSLGAEIEIWNGDLQNRTHSLSLFHKDALEPSDASGIEDQKLWIEERLREMVIHRRDTVLDVGGGMTGLNALIEEMGLVEMLGRLGIRLVLMYLLGNERADLDLLAQLSANSAFMPKATLLMFNSGLLTSGRSAKTAFDALMHHEVVIRAVGAGARIVQIPALSCMAAVTDRGLSFSDFAAGKQADGHASTSFFDQERVWLWLKRDIPNMFLRIPPEWLPAINQPLVVNTVR